MECGENAEQKGRRSVNRKLKTLYGQLTSYMTQLPVLGFNSSKYDLNLIKKKLAFHLRMHEAEGGFVVKRNNAYTCMSSDSLKFLDVSQYLAPGTSYAKFLKAYNVEEGKGHFPYEWFDDVTKLDVTSLPPHEAFFSSLKNTNISEEEYRYCQHVWKENKMTTFKDFLVWYNNLDVAPFVTAVERLQEFYFNKGIDVFKTSISVPGIARQLLFRTAKDAGVNFALFDKKSSDLYDTFKQNVVGGPSIIFNRHAKAGETFIRNNQNKLCQRIRGDDANALYLWAIGQEMPVGPFIRRRSEQGFKPERRDKWLSAYYWMDYLNSKAGTHIQHKLNYGSEKRVGKYVVDGWDSNTNTIYQFQGCYFHGHLCHLTRKVTNESWIEEQPEKLKKTRDTTSYLREQGYNVVEKWECDFDQD